MAKNLSLAVAGVGNNISALIQGVQFYKHLLAELPDGPLPGVRRADIGGFSVVDIDMVAAFDTNAEKVGKDLGDAIFAAPNNYPRLDVSVPHQGVTVLPGITPDDPHSPAAVATQLKSSGAEVLLYSLPTGLQWAATAYAEAALTAGVAFVNCTPESVARDAAMLARYTAADLPLIGDDLASHLGTSVVHRSLLTLLAERGLTLDSSYQLNLGGNEDFRNLREQGESKRESKLNALRQEGIAVQRVEVIPSAGYVAHLRDNKVAYLNIEGLGWAGTPVSIELRLKVQDSSNAAGVIIDLIRVAAAGRRIGLGGYLPAATAQLKSPAGGHPAHSAASVAENYRQLDRLISG